MSQYVKKAHEFNASKQKGMTFIEILIAVVILVIGILGAVAMQASAKKGSFDAMQRSVASALAQDIIERMRGNDANALADYVGSDYGTALNGLPDKRCNSQVSLCTPAEMVINDLYEWELALMGGDSFKGTTKKSGLSGVKACISHTVNAVTLVISWDGREEFGSGEDEVCGVKGKKRRSLSVQAFIN
jgi:type IV pilus assembly protein PilV